MPRAKPSIEEKMDREIRASLLAGQERKALQDSSVAKYIGTCKETYQKKKREPERFSIEEFRSLIKLFKFTDEEIIRMVKGA